MTIVRKHIRRVHGKTVSVGTHARQTGKSVKAIDRRIVAKKPGRRISEDGNVYFEYRRNRSDVNKKERL